jgi:two-component system response regulator YesN
MQWNGRKVLELAGAARIQSDDTFEVPSATAIPPPDLFVGRIVEYLHTHLADKVTLVQIAAHVHASPSTVSHRYRAFTGEPPIQTLKRMRILEAKIMMIRGHPLNEIVERLNFCDARHLALQFRRFEGMTPRQFRKQARGA